MTDAELVIRLIDLYDERDALQNRLPSVMFETGYLETKWQERGFSVSDPRLQRYRPRFLVIED